MMWESVYCIDWVDVGREGWWQRRMAAEKEAIVVWVGCCWILVLSLVTLSLLEQLVTVYSF